MGDDDGAALMDTLYNVMTQIAEVHENPETFTITDAQRAQTIKLIEKNQLPDYAMAFVEFVRLAEKMAEDGRNPRVYISY